MKRLLLGLALAGLVGALTACGGDDDDSLPTGDDDAVGTAYEENGAADRAGVISSDGATAPGATSGDSGGGGDTSTFETTRKIIFTTELGLETGDVVARYREVSAIARRYGGFTDGAQLRYERDDDGEEHPNAWVSIRVPSEQYETALDDIRTMSDVTVVSEAGSTTEVTEEYTDLQSRLRNLERSETQYLDLLAKAETVQDILIVQERIDGVRAQIEQVQGRINVLDDLVDLATITVSLREPPEAAVAAHDDNRNSFVEAWNDAWDAAREIGTAGAAASAWLMVAAIVLAPVAIVALTVAAIANRRRAGAQPAGTQGG